MLACSSFFWQPVISRRKNAGKNIKRVIENSFEINKYKPEPATKKI
jgi:hypothetical protein